MQTRVHTHRGVQIQTIIYRHTCAHTHTPLGLARDTVCIIYWNYRGQSKLRRSKQCLRGEREMGGWKQSQELEEWTKQFYSDLLNLFFHHAGSPFFSRRACQ